MLSVSFASKFVVCAIQFLVFYQFYRTFLVPKPLSSLKCLWLGLIPVLILSIVNMIGQPAINTIITLGLSYVFAEMQFNGKHFIKFVLSLVACSLFIVTEILVGLGFAFVFGNNLSNVISKPSHFFVLALLSKLVCFLITFLFAKKFSEQSLDNRDLGRAFWPFMMFPLFGILNITLLLYVELNRTTASFMTLFTIVIGMGLLLSSAVFFSAFDTALQRKDLENRLRLTQQSQLASDLLYREQKCNEEQMRKMVHDFRNQLLNLETLYGEGSADANSYRDTLLKTLDAKSATQIIDFRNSVLTVILQRTKERCAKAGVTFTERIGFDDFSFLDMMDTSSIFDNAVDNALSACLEMDGDTPRWLSIHGVAKHGFLVLTFQNSRQNDLVEIDGVLKTTKAEGGGHGLGMTNIRETAQRYGGDIYFKYDDQSFTLYVRLSLPPEMEI